MPNFGLMTHWNIKQVFVSPGRPQKISRDGLLASVEAWYTSGEGPGFYLCAWYVSGMEIDDEKIEDAVLAFCG